MRSRQKGMNCPTCDLQEVTVLESRKRADGARRRRYKCLACGYRWTQLYHGVCEPRIRLVRKSAPEQRRLTARQAVAVMLSDKSSASLAEKYGITRQAIDLVRTGQTYVEIYKRLERKGRRLRGQGRLVCEQCVHWRGESGCDFGFPDAGGDFATDCSLFREL